MSLDNKILELRLLFKDSSVGQVSIAKCAAKLQAFGKNVHDTAALEGFLREILIYQLEYEKADNSFRVFDRQEVEYLQLEGKIESDISGVKANILRLEEELKQQQIIREHRVECEHLATEVNKLTSRSTLKRKIDAVSHTLDSTKASIEVVETEISTKQAQFMDLAVAIAELQKKAISADEDPKGSVLEAEDGAEAGDEEEGEDTRGARNNKSDRDEEKVEPEDMEIDEDGNPLGDADDNENECIADDNEVDEN